MADYPGIGEATPNAQDRLRLFTILLGAKAPPRRRRRSFSLGGNRGDVHWLRRVSTADQSLDLQIDALTKAGCERIIADHASGG
jgi:hypothetical protein